MTGALADTGFLVALFRRSDRLRGAAREHLRAHTYRLTTVTPAIVETCFFLDARGKADLMEWVMRGGLAVAEVPVDAYADLKALILKYADRDIDFTDAALIWLAATSGCHSILTVDERDFSVYRLKGNKRFDILPWMSKVRRKR